MTPQQAEPVGCGMPEAMPVLLAALTALGVIIWVAAR